MRSTDGVRDLAFCSLHGHALIERALGGEEVGMADGAAAVEGGVVESGEPELDCLAVAALEGVSSHLSPPGAHAGRSCRAAPRGCAGSCREQQ